MKAKEVVRIVSTDHCDIFHNLTMMKHEGGDDLDIARWQRIITKNLSIGRMFWVLASVKRRFIPGNFVRFSFVLSSKDIVHL